MHIDTSGLKPMQRGRTDAALNRKYNFTDGGIMTLRSHLEAHTWHRKSSYTRRHEEHRRDLCYQPLAKPQTTYIVWRIVGGLDCNGQPNERGLDVPKSVYDLMNLPATHREQY